MTDNSALHRQLDRSRQDRDRAPLFETLVRACLVIVDQELLDHRLQMASAEGEQVVEQLPAGGKDEPAPTRGVDYPSTWAELNPKQSWFHPGPTSRYKGMVSACCASKT